MLGGVIVFAAVGLVDGILTALFRGNARTPGADIFRQVFRPGDCECVHPRGMLLVGGHAVAGRVDDGHAAAPCLLQEAIQDRTKLFDAADGIQTMMQIPHIAGDHRSLGGIPALCLNHRLIALAILGGFDLLAQLELQACVPGLFCRRLVCRAAEEHAERRRNRKSRSTPVLCHG